MMKFVVLKLDDIEKYCSFEQQEQLSGVCNEIEAGRFRDNKETEKRYFVVGTDEPYADNVKTLIEEHEGEEVTFGNS